MSVFSNPASGAAEDAAEYIDAILDLLDDQDPRAVLESTVAWCRAETSDLDPEDLLAPEAPGKWSIAGVLQHLADSELVWGYRLRRVLAEERPVLTGFDQDQWADRLGYATADPAAALALFTALRRANLVLLGRTPKADLQRVGVHEERGEESAEHMMRLYAGHDLAHRRQIERIIEAIDPE